jgi:uncharacterized protein (DUF697 family)
MTFLPLALVALGTTLHAPSSPAVRRRTDLLAATPEAEDIAKTPLDALQRTGQAFLTVGGFGFTMTAFQEGSKRAAVWRHSLTPRYVIGSSLMQAQRWGRVSAGFAGGRALGQVLRGVDDGTCAMMGSIFGGVLAAPNLAAIPSSVATFAAFGYFIDSFQKRSQGGDPQKQLENEFARRAKLQQELEACEKNIGALQAASAQA